MGNAQPPLNFPSSQVLDLCPLAFQGLGLCPSEVGLLFLSPEWPQARGTDLKPTVAQDSDNAEEDDRG